MIGVLRVAQRTLIWVFVQGIILLGFSALNPFSDTAAVVRVLMLIVAAILAAGIFPNSYLHRSRRTHSISGLSEVRACWY